MDRKEIQFLQMLLRGNWNPKPGKKVFTAPRLPVTLNEVPAPAPVFLAGVTANEGDGITPPVVFLQGKATTANEGGDGLPEPPAPVFLAGKR